VKLNVSRNEVLARHFGAMGAHFSAPEGPWLGAPRIDVIERLGFMLDFAGRGEEAEAQVLHIAPADRHLLLLIRSEGEKSKFLCGHDERHWFVAAIPEKARGVTNVETAKAALQPTVVAELAAGLPRKHRFARRNEAFLRQGEWFFVPAPYLSVQPWMILHNEPLARVGGTPHVLREAYRDAGVLVYTRGKRVIGAHEYARLDRGERHDWMARVRDPEVFARGTVRHPDHATITLPGWHRVVMNTERSARAMRHVVFID